MSLVIMHIPMKPLLPLKKRTYPLLPKVFLCLILFLNFVDFLMIRMFKHYKVLRHDLLMQIYLTQVTNGYVIPDLSLSS